MVPLGHFLQKLASGELEFGLKVLKPQGMELLPSGQNVPG